MNKEMSRAIRRHHYLRRKRNAKHYWGALFIPNYINSDKACAKIANTPHPCSCYCCGNHRRFKKWIEREYVADQDGDVSILLRYRTPRKKDRLTRQELKHSLEFELTAY